MSCTQFVLRFSGTYFYYGSHSFAEYILITAAFRSFEGAIAMERVRLVAAGVEDAERYIGFTNSLFKTELDLQYLFIWEYFTIHVFKNIGDRFEIKKAYRELWWNLFTRASFSAKLKLVFWRVYRYMNQGHWIRISNFFDSHFCYKEGLRSGETACREGRRPLNPDNIRKE